MDEKKTIFNYIAQIFATFGVIVLIFTVFTLVVGENARGYSTLFELGGKGISASVLLQLLLLAFLISVGQVLFLTDAAIKKMPMALRYFFFFLLVMAAVVVFVIVFGWFPMNNISAWIGFALSFIVCTAVSILLTNLAQRAENKKMEEALKRYKDL